MLNIVKRVKNILTSLFQVSITLITHFLISAVTLALILRKTNHMLVESGINSGAVPASVIVTPCLTKQTSKK